MTHILPSNRLSDLIRRLQGKTDGVSWITPEQVEDAAHEAGVALGRFLILATAAGIGLLAMWWAF